MRKFTCNSRCRCAVRQSPSESQAHVRDHKLTLVLMVKNVPRLMTCLHIYIYIYIYICLFIYIYLFIDTDAHTHTHTETERQRRRHRDRAGFAAGLHPSFSWPLKPDGVPEEVNLSSRCWPRDCLRQWITRSGCWLLSRIGLLQLMSQEEGPNQNHLG